MKPPRHLPHRAQDLQALLDALRAKPYAHDFYLTMRRIEAYAAPGPRVGRAARPAQEHVRLGQDPDLDFAPASMTSFVEGKAGPPRLGVRFYGLYGPQGPMPTHVTEYARERQRHHADPTLVRFSDIFHRRLLALFFRAWGNAQPAVHADRPDDDQYGKWVSALFGAAPPAFRGRTDVPDHARRFRAGLLSHTTRHAEGLTRLLSDYFRMPVRIESFAGHWLSLEPGDVTRLGSGSVAEPRAQLGVSAVAGSKVWDRQYRFRIHLGPLTLAQYRSMLPGQVALRRLRDWVQQYLGLALSWDVRVGLKASEVPALRLGGREGLGWSTWLPTAAGHRDRHDLVLQVPIREPAPPGTAQTDVVDPSLPA